MFQTIAQMLASVVILLTFLPHAIAVRDLIRYQPSDTLKKQNDDVVDEFLNPVQNDFFRALFEDRNHEWITSMSMPSPHSPTATPMHPTLYPSTNWSPAASLSPTIISSANDVPTPTPQVKTRQPVLTPFPSHKPLNTNIPIPMEPTTKLPSVLPTNPPTTSQETPSAPTTNEGPNQLSNDPTMTPMPTTMRSSTQTSKSPQNNNSPTLQENDVFTCDFNNILSIAELPASIATTDVQFKVRYAVESKTNQSNYIENLERLILITALAGALQCETGGIFFTNFTGASKGRSKEILGVSMNTTRTDDNCVASIAPCKVFETQFQVAINKISDPDIAAFLGYVMLKENMDDGTFAKTIPKIDRCEYLKPLPLLPPMSQNNGTNQEESQSTERLSVSPWSLAAVSAMCAGGVIAIAVWHKKRVYRNRRHMELVEDASVGSPLDS